MNISIAKDFSDVPWGRYPADGDVCGQIFREQFLEKLLRESQEVLIISLDGVEGLGSSFLDEAFGGLVRRCHIPESTLRGRLKIETTQPELRMYVDLIWRYIAQAQTEIGRELASA